MFVFPQCACNEMPLATKVSGWTCINHSELPRHRNELNQAVISLITFQVTGP